MKFVENAEIHFFDSVGRNFIAAVEPDENAGVLAQDVNLTAQRVGGDFVVLGLPALAKLPGIAAGPAGHDENAQAVGFFVELFAIEAAFEANRVQAHVADVAEVSVEALGRPAQENVGGPGSAADQEIATVDFEKAV